MDFVGCAAVEPVGVGEVGEAARAFGVGAVALDAVGVEQVFADGAGFGLFGGVFHGHFGVFGVNRAVFFLRGFDFGLVFADAGTVAQAFEVAQAGVEGEVADAEQPGEDVEVEPPAGHGVVVLFDAVPVVAGGFDVFAFGRRFDFVLREQQPDQADKAEDDDADNVVVPEITGEM